MQPFHLQEGILQCVFNGFTDVEQPGPQVTWSSCVCDNRRGRWIKAPHRRVRCPELHCPGHSETNSKKLGSMHSHTTSSTCESESGDKPSVHVWQINKRNPSIQWKVSQSQEGPTDTYIWHAWLNPLSYSPENITTLLLGYTPDTKLKGLKINK